MMKKKMSETRAWSYVFMGGLLELIWASGFKYPAVPTILVLISLIISFDLIIKAARVLPVSTVYAVFTGIGTMGTTVIDIIFSDQSIHFSRIIFIVVLIICIVGLKLTSRGCKE